MFYLIDTLKLQDGLASSWCTTTRMCFFCHEFRVPVAPRKKCTESQVISHTWVMSDTWVSTHEWVMSPIRMKESPHTREFCLTHGWVMSHVLLTESSHTRQSFLTHEWVMSHIRMDESSHTCESCLTRVKSHERIHESPLFTTNESSLIYVCTVTSSTWTSHVP